MQNIDMKNIIITILLVSTNFVFSQTNEEFIKELKALKNKNEQLYERLNQQEEKNNNSILELSDSIKKLKSDISTINTKISASEQKLIGQIQSESNLNNGKISNVNEVISKKTFYGMIAIFAVIFLSTIVFIVFKRRQNADKSDLINKLDNSTNKINQELSSTKSNVISLESRLMEEYSKQVAGLEQLVSTISQLNTLNDSGSSSEPDHSLTLKIADEITRINAFANTLDPSKQEAIALKLSVTRIIDNFKVNNYEIVDLLGQKYDDRLNIEVLGEEVDNNLKPGEEIISKIIKPLVKFDGKQIQAAQVEISIGQ